MMGDEEDYYMSRAFDDDQHEYEEALHKIRSKLRAGSGKGPSRGKAEREPVISVAKVESDRSRKNSRTKGNRAELDVAKMFSEWCGEVVRRTPQSGGWSNARFGVTADLVCANKAFPFSVEIKHREGWALDDLVTGVRKDHDKSIVQWWKQCVESCPKSTKCYCDWCRGRDSIRGSDCTNKIKKPVLVFRRNHQPWLVMVRADFHVSDPSAITATVLGDHVTVILLERFLELTQVPEGLAHHKKP